MAISLSVLIVEDSESDAALTVRALDKAGYNVLPERVETAGQLIAALEKRKWDVIIADHSLPQFDAFKALQILNERNIDIPFIVVSGTIGEKTAVGLMKSGAHDYVMKNNLARLIPSIEREIKEANVRRERRIEDEKYRRSARQWRAAFDAISDMFCLLDTESKIIRCNKAMRDVIGRPFKEIIGQHCWELVHGTTCPIEGCPMVRMRESCRREVSSCPVKGRLWETTVDPLLDEAGNFVGAVHVMVDVTDQKKEENERKEWQEKYYTLIESATEGIVVAQDGVRKFVNKKLAEMYGYSVEELLGQPITAIMHANDKEISMQSYQMRLKGEATVSNDARILIKSGQYHWFRFNGISIMWEGRPASLVFVTDVNEQKIAEEALIKSEQKYRSLFEDSRDAITITTIDGKFLDVNQAMLDLYGYTREEMLALSVVSTYVDPESRNKFKTEIQKTGSIKDFEVKFRRKDGTIIDCLLTSTVWRDEHGNIAGYRGIKRDVTLQKELECDLKEALVKVQKTAEGIINVVSSMSELKDPYTAGHQRRVAQLARIIADEMGLPGETIEGIRIAGTIHDIGKLAVPAEILSKPGRLSEMEFSLLKVHPQAGYDILKTIDFPWPVAQIVLQHHLRLDGSGYPDILKGKEIMLEARILAVADVVEAMSSHRPYRPSLGVEKALEEISQNSGKLYDPDAVDACLTVFRKKGFKFE